MEPMNQVDRLMEITSTYTKHGWVLRRILLTGPSLEFWRGRQPLPFTNVEVRPSEVDALWFSRSSHQEREAWELRLIAEAPYALFETFEGDETEEQRDEARLEMEARMREYVSK